MRELREQVEKLERQVKEKDERILSLESSLSDTTRRLTEADVELEKLRKRADVVRRKSPHIAYTDTKTHPTHTWRRKRQCK